MVSGFLVKHSYIIIFTCARETACMIRATRTTNITETALLCAESVHFLVIHLSGLMLIAFHWFLTRWRQNLRTKYEQ